VSVFSGRPVLDAAPDIERHPPCEFCCEPTDSRARDEHDEPLPMCPRCIAAWAKATVCPLRLVP